MNQAEQLQAPFEGCLEGDDTGQGASIQIAGNLCQDTIDQAGTGPRFHADCRVKRLCAKSA